MPDDVLRTFQQQEAQTTAQKVKFNRWSLALIELMIEEQEQKLLASDMPVDGDPHRAQAAGDNFWEEL